MLRPVLTALAALPLVLPPAMALADSHRKHATLRQASQAAPPKDCTRFNGRVGYYGNPWCTRAEEDRWDRWQASRIGKR